MKTGSFLRRFAAPALGFVENGSSAYIAESSKGVERPSAVLVVSFRPDYLSGSRFAFDDWQ
jgi:hypothetical protein